MSIIIDNTEYFTLTEVATAAGKSKQTIKRWALANKIPQPQRLESNGWLIYPEDQKNAIIQFANRIVGSKNQ